MKPIASSRRSIGTRIEDQALEWWLHESPSRSRVRLLRRNYQCRCGEIDLILEENQPRGGMELVFVEVRYRGKGGWVDGVQSVDWVKRKRLTRTAQWFLMSYRGPASGVRFDILSWNGCSWTHLPHAWYPDS